MFNKYLNAYIKICQRAKTRECIEGDYCEKHHVFPKSIYGCNDFLVSLTAFEHCIVHWLLYKAFQIRYGKDYRTNKMGYAYIAMNMYVNRNRQVAESAKQYEMFKQFQSDFMKDLWTQDEFRNKNITARKNAYARPEVKKQMSESRSKYLSLPGVKESISKNQKEVWNTQEKKDYAIKRRYEQINDAELHKRMVENMTASHRTDEYRQKASQISKDYYKIPGNIEKNSEIQKKYWNSEEGKLKKKLESEMKKARQCKWMNNGVENKMVSIVDQDEYLLNGWSYKKMKKDLQMRWMNNGEINTFATLEKQHEYLLNNWKYGKIK